MKFRRSASRPYIICDIQSDFQRIHLLGDRGDAGVFHLLLNETMQIVTPWEWVYHHALVDSRLRLLGRRPERVLILGGGDGCAARNVLKYRPDEVVQIEIDPAMIELAREHPVMTRINKGALDRIRVIVGDAFAAPESGLGRFDFIIVDLTEPDELSGALYSREFVGKLIGMLNPGGVLSAYYNKEMQHFGGEGRRYFVPTWGTADIWHYRQPEGM